MPKLLEGKTAIVLGVWNKWSIAYAIAQAFAREGATLLLTIKTTAPSRRSRSWGASSAQRTFSPVTCSRRRTWTTWVRR